MIDPKAKLPLAEPPPAQPVFNWERFTILALIGSGLLCLVAPFYVLYFRLVQRLIP